MACTACWNSIVVQITNGLCEKSLLYLAIVRDQSTNKTSCFESALDPIMRKDDEEYDRYVYAEFLKPTKERSVKPQEPDFCHTILNDFTPEVLVRQHKTNRVG